jgi:hypothetical protein
MPLGDGVLDIKRLVADDTVTRLRSLVNTDEVPTIASADKLDDGFMNEGPLPGFFPIHGSGKAKLVRGARRLYAMPGKRNKITTIRMAVACVAESYASDEAAARVGAMELVTWCKDAIDGWRPAYMLKPFDYDTDRFVMRSSDGTRVLYEVLFESEAEEFTTPAPTPAP